MVGLVFLWFTLQLGCDAERASIPSCKHVSTTLRRSRPHATYKKTLALESWIRREEKSRFRISLCSNNPFISMGRKRHRERPLKFPARNELYDDKLGNLYLQIFCKKFLSGFILFKKFNIHVL